MRRLERLRHAELEAVRAWFRPGSRVLDLGGGNGYQASIIASWGCAVRSIDLPGRPPAAVQHYPVIEYDGRHIPFADGSFDLVYSSNVLEHVTHLSELLADVRRVLRPDGAALHVVPSAAWRAWTTIGHYLYPVKLALAWCGLGSDEASLPSITAVAARKGVLYTARRVLVPGPHGEYPSALAELYYFSRRRWRRLFERQGFAVAAASGSGLFYTGYCLLPALSIDTRRALSRRLGSACHVFLTHPVASAPRAETHGLDHPLLRGERAHAS